jgi:hypothetical protein
MKSVNQPTPNRGVRRFMRRPSSASLVSLAAHVVLGILILNAIELPAVFDRFLQSDRAARPVAEQVEFVALTPPDEPVRRGPVASPPTAPSRAPIVAPQEVVPLVAPTEVPRELPPPATAVDTIRGRGITGPLRGGSGPTRGVQPAYDDPRVWAGDPEFIYAPKTDQDRLDSALMATLRRHMDSVATNRYSPNKFERGDWTFERNGQKYGIDQQFIRLGPVQIPTALLALLPLNRMQGNPIQLERDRNAAFMRNDILYHAQAAMNEEQFRKAVAAIRDRKERERRQRTSATSPGPIASPGERPPE